MMAWGYTTLAPIEKMDRENHAITMADGVKNFNRTPWNVATDFGYALPCRFYVENVLEELDQPGEWCLDADEGKVYFWPPDDGIVAQASCLPLSGKSRQDTCATMADRMLALQWRAEVTAPALDSLLELRGASLITISGFTFTETRNAGSNMHREGVDGAGAMFSVEGWAYCGEAVRLQPGGVLSDRELPLY